MFEEYPQEYFLKLSKDELLGRIILNKLENRFSAELDIVLKESKKIYKHIGIHDDFGPHYDKDEVLQIAVQKFSNYITIE